MDGQPFQCASQRRMEGINSQAPQPLQAAEILGHVPLQGVVEESPVHGGTEFSGAHSAASRNLKHPRKATLDRRQGARKYSRRQHEQSQQLNKPHTKRERLPG